MIQNQFRYERVNQSKNFATIPSCNVDTFQLLILFATEKMYVYNTRKTHKMNNLHDVSCKMICLSCRRVKICLHILSLDIWINKYMHYIFPNGNEYYKYNFKKFPSVLFAFVVVVSKFMEQWNLSIFFRSVLIGVHRSNK